MRTRWWTPQGPGADSFDVVLADDPTVAGPFLALHRIGAAACEQAAAVPLVDAAVLGDHLGSATDLTRVLLDSWVGKSDAGAYGELLARDLLEEARTSAQRLFNALVAKGVAPPLAAERTGAVYGVPSAYIGRYREVAVAPGMTARVLADAADRTLFGYVARLVEVESAEVAKAAATLDDPTTTHWDARTAGGQFAPRVGARVTVPTASGPQDITSWLQAQMAQLDAPAEAPAPEVDKPKPEIKRLKRLKRVKVIGAKKPEEKTEAAAPEVATKEPTTAARQKVQRRRVERAAVARQKLARKKVSRRQVERIHLASAAPLGRPLGEVAPDVHKTIRGRQDLSYAEMDGNVTVVLDMASAQKLIENSGGNPFGGKNPPVFRAGYLVDAGGGVVARTDSGQHEEQVRSVADQLGGDEPVVEHIDAATVARWDDRQTANELHARKAAMWFRVAPPDLRDDEDVDPDDQIHDAVDEATGDIVLVYDPSHDESATSLNRVAEFRMQDPRAAIDPGKQEQIRLDPNQAYKIVPRPPYDPDTDSFSFMPADVFDTRNKVWRVVYYLEPVDQNEVDRAITNIENRRYPDTSRRELGKAASTRDNPATAYHDARDATGRFTVEGQDITSWLNDQMRAQQAQEKPQPSKEIKRIKRLRRVKVIGSSTSAPAPAEQPQEEARTAHAPVARQQVTRQRVARQKVARQKVARQQLARQVRGREPMGNATTVLHANQEYAVVMPDQAQNLLATWHAKLWDSRLNQTLPPRMRQDLNRAVAVGYGTEVDGKLADAHFELSADAGDYAVSRTTFVASGPDDPRLKQEAAILRGLMEEGTITSAVVREIIDDDGQQKVEVETYRTRRPMAPVVLLAFDKGVTLDNASGMRAVERIRSHQLGRDYDPDEAAEANPVSLDVYVVRITGPTPSERA